MEPKRWGPFNGRQLTTMFIALIVGLVAIPTGAWAANNLSKVKIVDAHGTNVAQVDPAGDLKVVSVPQIGQALFTEEAFSSVGACTTLAHPPSNKTLVVSAINVDVASGTFPAEIEILSSKSTCTSGNIAGAGYVTFPAAGSYELTYPSGLALKAGTTLVARVHNGVTATFRTVTNGYLRVGSDCPAVQSTTCFG